MSDLYPTTSTVLQDAAFEGFPLLNLVTWDERTLVQAQDFNGTAVQRLHFPEVRVRTPGFCLYMPLESAGYAPLPKLPLYYGIVRYTVLLVCIQSIPVGGRKPRLFGS